MARWQKAGTYPIAGGAVHFGMGPGTIVEANEFFSQASAQSDAK